MSTTKIGKGDTDATPTSKALSLPGDIVAKQDKMSSIVLPLNHSSQL